MNEWVAEAYVHNNPAACTNLGAIRVTPEFSQWSVRHRAIEDLRMYGVEIAEQEDLSDPTNQTRNHPWSDGELAQILAGVARVGTAFDYAGVSGQSPQETFLTVMIGEEQPPYLLFLRLSSQKPAVGAPWERYYSNSTDGDGAFDGGVDNGNCKSFPQYQFNDDRRARVIACRGELDNSVSQPPVVGEISQYTAVHELAHIFDARVGGQLTVEMHTPNGEIIIADCGTVGINRTTVMGAKAGIPWDRGIRGWGSIGFSAFQQAVDNKNTPLETGADMFLNWVYRRTSDNPPNAPATSLCDLSQATPEIGDWQGFRNINEMGEFDARLPGNARYLWMENTMISLLGPWRSQQ